jgi:hypothetical protein
LNIKSLSTSLSARSLHQESRHDKNCFFPKAARLHFSLDNIDHFTRHTAADIGGADFVRDGFPPALV